MKKSRASLFFTLVVVMIMIIEVSACTTKTASSSAISTIASQTSLTTPPSQSSSTSTTMPTLTSTLTPTTNSPTMPTLTTATIPTTTTTSTTPLTDEGEATEFDGHKLTPISQQNNNALAGTQYIDEATYKLTIDGLVDHPLTLSYADLQSYPQISQLMDLNCVEGWNFTAKWTGPSLSAIFAAAGVQVSC